MAPPPTVTASGAGAPAKPHGQPVIAAPAVTVVVPCYNAEKWVARTIRSVLEEAHPALDLIVVDDGSTDRSAAILAAFADRIRVESGGPRGACAARNLGLSLCRTPYVMFLDADDYVEDGLIGGLAEALERTGADLAFGRFAKEQAGQARVLFDNFTDGAPPIEVFRSWMDGRWVPPCSVMWRTEFLSRIGGWRPDLLMNQDGELILRAMLHEPRLCAVGQGLGVYNLHDEPSVSKIRTPDALQSEVRALGDLADLARGTPFEPALSGFRDRAYHLAWMAHDRGHPDIGDQALGLARAVGLKGHYGSPAHRLACAVLGLKWKTRLSKALRWLRPGSYVRAPGRGRSPLSGGK